MFYYTITSTTLVLVFICNVVTRFAIISVDQDHVQESSQVSEKFLFTDDESRDAANIVQCKQRGVENCRLVTIDTGYTRSLEEGDYVKLIQDLDLEMQVQLVYLPSKEIINLGYLPSKNLCKIFIF